MIVILQGYVPEYLLKSERRATSPNYVPEVMVTGKERHYIMMLTESQAAPGLLTAAP